MSKLQWIGLDELQQAESMPIVKCVGVVSRLESKHNYFSFNLESQTSNIEATLYQDQRLYSTLKLPQMGNSVIVVGSVHRRETANNGSIIKIKIKLFKIISPLEMEKILKNVQQSRKNRENESYSVGIASKTKRSILNQLKNGVSSVEIRSLIMGCVYLTLQNNLDLNSYTFSWYSIQKHRLTKSYLESKKLKEQSGEYLREFIEPELKYLAEMSQIEEKEKIQGQTLYVIYRKIFTRFEMRILGIINEKQKTGTFLNEIVLILNKQQGLVDERKYIFNDNFVQRILKKFIEQSRIFKTSDKVLYPNS